VTFISGLILQLNKEKVIMIMRIFNNFKYKINYLYRLISCIFTAFVDRIFNIINTVNRSDNDNLVADLKGYPAPNLTHNNNVKLNEKLYFIYVYALNFSTKYPDHLWQIKLNIIYIEENVLYILKQNIDENTVLYFKIEIFFYYYVDPEKIERFRSTSEFSLQLKNGTNNIVYELTELISFKIYIANIYKVKFSFYKKN